MYPKNNTFVQLTYIGGWITNLTKILAAMDKTCSVKQKPTLASCRVVSCGQIKMSKLTTEHWPRCCGCRVYSCVLWPAFMWVDAKGK